MEITATALQTVETNNNVLFTETPIGGSCSIIHREGSGLVTLRGITSQCRARFRASFGANIAVPDGQTAGPISLALAINGEPVPATVMTISSAMTERFFNVYSSIFIEVPAGCCNQISVRNISNIPVEVQNANLIIERVA